MGRRDFGPECEFAHFDDLLLELVRPLGQLYGKWRLVTKASTFKDSYSKCLGLFTKAAPEGRKNPSRGRQS
ncbi:MAG: hypothetical protein KDA80_05395, partial [Planctomycetaceae bacterium]|nr:hypothetical protein [Planctomycetaceae bacterium]